jgi:hypothetical protein
MRAPMPRPAVIVAALVAGLSSPGCGGHRWGGGTTSHLAQTIAKPASADAQAP